MLLLSLTLGFAQAKSDLGPTPLLPPAEGEREARTLVANLLAQQPTQSTTSTGMLKIRDANDQSQEVPVKIEVVATPTNFLNIYQTFSRTGPESMKLTIIHTEGQPNQYLLSQPAGAPPKQLAPGQLMVPFAGSDFWVADLGLEFLHWPQQRVLKKQMRRGQFCDVLQSLNPHPAPGGYSRVVSWVAINQPDAIVIVHADAYGPQGELLKQFDPKKVEKVNGAWQLSEMEIRNRRTGSETRFEFNLEGE